MFRTEVSFKRMVNAFCCLSISFERFSGVSVSMGALNHEIDEIRERFFLRCAICFEDEESGRGVIGRGEATRNARRLFCAPFCSQWYFYLVIAVLSPGYILDENGAGQCRGNIV